MSLATVFNNLSVKLKIGLGYAVIMTIMAIVGVASFFQLVAIGDDMEKYSHRVKIVDSSNEVERSFVEYRRLVAQSLKEEDVKAVAKLAEKRVRKAIEKTEGKVNNQDKLALLNDLKDKFVKYSKLAAEAQNLVKAEHDIEEKVLDKDSRILHYDLEKLLKLSTKNGDTNTAILANEALKELLQAEIFANITLGRHDQNARAKADEKLAIFEGLIAKLDRSISDPEGRAAIDEIKVLEAEYRQGFEKAMGMNQKVWDITHDDMYQLANIISKDADEIRQRAIAEELKYKNHAMSLVQSTEWLIAISVLVGAILGGVLATFIGNTIANPIKTIADVLQELARGNASVEVPYVDREDEVGANARSANIFKENIQKMTDLEKDRAEAAARVAEKRKQEMSKLASDFQAAVGGIVQSVSSASGQLESAAGKMAQGAESTQQLSSLAASASDQTSTNVQSVAAASEEMAATVSEISRQVQQSTNIADSAVTQAARTNERVQELSQSAERIGNVIELINTIAGQTNLLALNATIEAARAGDAGKGFAVVAEEVKALAEQTSNATNEIASQIAAMQTATGDAVGAIQ